MECEELVQSQVELEEFDDDSHDDAEDETRASAEDEYH